MCVDKSTIGLHYLPISFMLAISVLSLSLFLFFLSYDYGFPLSVFFAVAQLTTKIKHLSSVLHKKVTIEPIISLFQSILDYFHCIIYPKKRRRVFSLYYFSVYLFIIIIIIIIIFNTFLDPILH